MADSKDSWQAKQDDTMTKIDSSSIVEMEIMDDDGSDSDYDTNVTDDKSKSNQSEEDNGQFMDSMRKQFGQNVSSYVWQTGRQQAQKALNVYGNIDILRPYFNVEPHEVRRRLVYSLIPTLFTTKRQKAHRELYGPTMVVFTLIALLLFQMKTSDHQVQEGTLMGSAFAVCFGYWIGASSFVWFLSYVCNSHITYLQILSLMGYALFSHCVVLFLGTMIHTSHDHLFFFLLWGILGGLSTLKMISVLTSRTTGAAQKMIITGIVVALHMLFLLYLHFAYHQIVEDLSAIESKPLEIKSFEETKSIVERDLPDEQVKQAQKTLDSLTAVQQMKENIPL